LITSAFLNTNWTWSNTKSDKPLWTPLATHFNNTKSNWAAANWKPLAHINQGDTAIIAQGDATGRIIFHDNDKYGQWSYLHLQGKNDTVITYITVYQVCKKPTNGQGITAFHQQEITFRTEKRLNTNPRHNFREDLIRFVKAQQARGYLIILASDFNEDISTNHTNLQHISQHCQLLDIWKQRIPHHKEPSTYIRGSKRIDYTLISRQLSPAVEAVGYEPFYYTTSSDHRGMFIDFNTDKLFGNKTNTMHSAKSWLLNLKFPLGRKIYILAAADHAHQHNLFERLQTFMDSHERDDAFTEKSWSNHRRMLWHRRTEMQ
jgi:hypothetical protein